MDTQGIHLCLADEAWARARAHWSRRKLAEKFSAPLSLVNVPGSPRPNPEIQYPRGGAVNCTGGQAIGPHWGNAGKAADLSHPAKLAPAGGKPARSKRSKKADTVYTSDVFHLQLEPDSRTARRTTDIALAIASDPACGNPTDKLDAAGTRHA